jgi:hypothetical protein
MGHVESGHNVNIHHRDRSPGSAYGSVRRRSRRRGELPPCRSNHAVGSLYASLTAAWASSTNSAISGARRVATHASRTSLGGMSVIGAQATSERW